jgi:hypothetical protein
MLRYPLCFVGRGCYTYSMNNNTNPNLPANAISAADVEVGMYIVRPGGYVSQVTLVRWFGFDGAITADGERIRVNRAGTLRLADPLD